MNDATLTVQTSADPPRPSALGGETIGRFELIAKIGDGSMGTVMLARDPELERNVAIKLLHRGDPLRLLREAKSLARLSHPNVVSVYEIGERDGQAFVAMEYVDGATLRGWLLERARAPRRILELLLQCARGLEAAHAAALVHRDFKPANVIVGRDGRARVLDFGLVRHDEVLESAVDDHELASELERSLTSSGAILGTPAYMAPEQFLGQRADHRSDQFSLCVVAFEALFGQRPFPGSNFAELRTAVLAGDRVAVPTTSGVARRVREAILRGLSIDPNQRWSSMTELIHELEAAMADAGLREYLRRVGPRKPRARAQVVEQGELYGRERELAELATCVGEQRAKLVLVRGEAGIGKSALIERCCQSARERGVVVVATKFEQLGTTPLAGFVELVESAVREWMATDASTREQLATRLRATLGSNAAVLTELTAQAEQLLGPQPPLAEAAGPAEARNRFQGAIERFFAVLASTSERGLLVVLDDLHWADPSSLELLGHLQLAGLTMIASVRPLEAEANPNLIELLAKLEVTTVSVGPLTRAAIEALLVDSLDADAELVAPLAALALDRTGGNPLFVHQLLQTLDAEDLLRFDAHAGGWSWSLDEIARRPTSSDVASLLAARLGSLPDSTRELLRAASLIGKHCSLASLAAIAGRDPAGTLALLWPAFDQALLVIAGELPDLREHGSNATLELSADAAAAISVGFRHDRIQSAALAGVDDTTLARLHAEIGRALLRTRDEAASSVRVFEIADQLNRGRAQLEPAERETLIELDLDCGRRALRAAAYPAALDYFTAAAELLAELDADNHPRRFAAELARARASYLAGHDDEAEQLFARLRAQARGPSEHREVHRLEIEHAMLSSRFEAGFAASRVLFELDGIELPTRDEEVLPLLGAELANVEAALAGREIASLAELPPLDDADALALLEHLNRFGVLCYRTARPLLLSWAIAKMTGLSMRGRSRLAGYTYSNYAFLLAVQGDLSRARAFSQLAIRLASDYGDALLHARTIVVAHGLVGHHHLPFAELVASLRAAMPASVEAGDLMHASDIVLLGDYLALASGAPLLELWAQVEQHVAFLRRSAPAPLAAFYAPHVLFLLCALTGRSSATLGVELDPDAFARSFAEHPLAQGWHLSALTKLEYLRGEYPPLDELERRVGLVSAAVVGQHHGFECRFYASLSALAQARVDARPEELEELVARWQSELEPLVASCPANYAPMHTLVEAERARRAHAPLERVLTLYEQAIDGASAAGSLDKEALGSRLYAAYWSARGNQRSAGVHARAAAELYRRWGSPVLASAAEAWAAHQGNG